MNEHNKTESVIGTENKQMFAGREGSEGKSPASSHWLGRSVEFGLSSVGLGFV